MRLSRCLQNSPILCAFEVREHQDAEERRTAESAFEQLHLLLVVMPTPPRG